MTSLPAEGPPVHCLFHASMAPPGTIPVTFKDGRSSECSILMPTTKSSATRRVNSKTIPPLSQITNGDDIIEGDFMPGAILPLDRGVRLGVMLSLFGLASKFVLPGLPNMVVLLGLPNKVGKCGLLCNVLEGVPLSVFELPGD